MKKLFFTIAMMVMITFTMNAQQIATPGTKALRLQVLIQGKPVWLVFPDGGKITSKGAHWKISRKKGLTESNCGYTRVGRVISVQGTGPSNVSFSGMKVAIKCDVEIVNTQYPTSILVGPHVRPQ